MEQEIVYTVVRKTLKKELPHLQDCPRRGIRRLLDLGINYFADGATEKKFFRWMKEELRDPHNPYHRYMEHIAGNVCHDLLATFIADLGYNSLSYGADRLRAISHKAGHHIPWLLMFDAGRDCPGWLLPMWAIIDQGKSLGIFSYLVRLDSNRRALRSILNLIEHERECAFFLHVSEDILNDATLARIVASQNIFLLLELDDSKPEAKETARALRAQKCLYGKVVSHNKDPRDALGESEYAADAGIHTLFFIRKRDGRYPQDAMDGGFRSRIYDRNGMPVLALDFDEIAFYIDSGISGRACLGMIGPDGNFGYMEPGSHMVDTEFNVLDDELETILSRTMPR